MGKKTILLLIIAFVFLSLSCSTTPKDFGQLAFIFGKIESAEGDLALKYVDFVSCSFYEKSKSYEADVHKQKGYFWLKDLKKGSYRAVGFFQQTLGQMLGFGNSNGSYYSLSKYGSGPFLVRIQKPGVYYMGTYKYGINQKNYR